MDAFCPCWCKIDLWVSLSEEKKKVSIRPPFSRLTRWVLENGLMVVSSLTLHSGQSYPGTPELPGSRTGTHPDGRGWREDSVSFITARNSHCMMGLSHLCLFILKFNRLNEGLNVILWIEKSLICAMQLKISIHSSITSLELHQQKRFLMTETLQNVK